MLDFIIQTPLFLACLIFLLGLVVIIHELGHYCAGRTFGAAVESLSVGFGSSISERMDKNGTRWRVNWLPLGGFVKFVGENEFSEASDANRPRPLGKAYMQLSPWARIGVSLAGPAANMFLAVVLFSSVLLITGTYETRVKILNTQPKEAAALAGLQAGDILHSINNKPITKSADIQMALLMTAGRSLPVSVDRGDTRLTYMVTPREVMRKNDLGQVQPQAFLGVELAEMAEATQVKRLNPFEALIAGTQQTVNIVGLTTRMLGRLITGHEPINSLSGPIVLGDTGRRLVNVSMEQVQVPLFERLYFLGLNMLALLAAISVGIGYMNLLPLPTLDGGHVVFNMYEGIRGKPLPQKIIGAALYAGMGLLAVMFVVITIGDIADIGLFSLVKG